MIVFNNYFKIVKKHLGLIIMFAAISIGISVANTRYNSTTENYVATNPDLAIINRDSSELVDSFIEYIDKNAELIKVNDNEKDIQDSLYTTKVIAVIIIPENYTQDFLDGNKPQIEIKKSVKNYSTYAEILINRYLKIADIYNASGMKEENILTAIQQDLQKEIKIEVQQKQGTSNLEKVAIFYNFENYAFLSIFILIIGTIMCVFNNQNIKKRNLVSKTKQKSFTNQLFLGHMCLTLAIWLIFVLVSIIVYKNAIFTMNALLMIINSLIFAITATSIAYLVGSFVKNQNVISGIQNVVALGLSFTSGCFVSTQLLSDKVVNFSKIFPSYWYIKTNTDIAKLVSFDLESLKPILINYAIVMGFGIIYFIISKIIVKRRKTM